MWADKNFVHLIKTRLCNCTHADSVWDRDWLQFRRPMYTIISKAPLKRLKRPWTDDMNKSSCKVYTAIFCKSADELLLLISVNRRRNNGWLNEQKLLKPSDLWSLLKFKVLTSQRTSQSWGVLCHLTTWRIDCCARDKHHLVRTTERAQTNRQDTDKAATCWIQCGRAPSYM